MTITNLNIPGNQLAAIKSGKKDSQGDDFSIEKSQFERQKHKQRYSQLATLLTDNELAKFSERIKEAMKPNE